jgi:predicted N-acetyltransferase YhbS
MVFASVANWLHRQWLEAWGLSQQEAESELRDRLHRNKLPMAWVALAGGIPVGTVSLVADEKPFDAVRICCLAGLYVVPAWRDRGIGRQLCRYAVRRARGLGYPEIGLYTIDQEAFYHHLSWTTLSPAVIDGYDGPVLATFMQRRTADFTQ